MSLAEILTPAEMAEFHLDEEDMRRQSEQFDAENFEETDKSWESEEYTNPVPVVAETIVERILRSQHIKNIVARPDYVLLLAVRHKKWIPYVKEAWLSATNCVDDGRWRGMDKEDDKRNPVGIAIITQSVDERSAYALKDVRKTMARSAIAGRPCILFSCWPKGSYVTDDIAMLLDADIYAHPTAADIATAYQRMGGAEEDGGIITEDVAAQLTPWGVAAAYRAGMTADQWVDRLLRVTVAQTDAMQREAEADAAKNKSSFGKTKTKAEFVDLAGVPPIEERHGMGEFSAWCANLKHDLAAYRKGGLPWEMLDRGILLSGAPGVGKTSAVRSLAVSLNVNLIAGSYSIWLGQGDGHQGTLLSGMRACFAAARESGEPVILFIDEIDAFGCRDRGMTDEHHRNWLAGTIGGLLQELDGVSGRGKIIVIGATNRPTEIDPAILRSGRLDKHVSIPLPDAEGLAQIMRSYLGAECLDADLLQLGHEMAGSTGADVEQVVRNARRIARGQKRPMQTDDLLIALRGVDPRTPGELFRDCVHEAAHAVASEVLLPGSVLSATVRVSGGSLGGVAIRPLGTSCTDVEMRYRIRVLLAGRAADIAINRCIDVGSGGPENSDLAVATHYALQYALTYGFAAKGSGIRWRGMHRPEDTPKVLKDNPDSASVVEQLLADELEEAIMMMKVHLRTVTTLALQLARKTTLRGDEIRQLLEQQRSLPPQTENERNPHDLVASP